MAVTEEAALRMLSPRGAFRGFFCLQILRRRRGLFNKTFPLRAQNVCVVWG